MYFKARLEVGKHKNERIMHIAERDMMKALDVTNKIRNSKLLEIKKIDRNDYKKGLDKKYD